MVDLRRTAMMTALLRWDEERLRAAVLT